MKKHILAMTFAASLLAAAACSTMSGAPEGSDPSIRDDVLERLHTDALTSRAAFGVAVNDGVVILSGSVRDPALRMRAKAIARGASGVKGVIDETAGERLSSP